MVENRIILLSGKRKSGKDYISEKLVESIGKDKCTIVRISEPIKSHYANMNNLDLSELMSDNKYKENFREDMIIWSDQIRRKDPGYFCQAACRKASPELLWVVSDIRRKTDIEWFKQNYKNQIRSVRISANDQTRINRGFVFTLGNVASDYNEFIVSISFSITITHSCDMNNSLELGMKETMVGLFPSSAVLTLLCNNVNIWCGTTHDHLTYKLKIKTIE